MTTVQNQIKSFTLLLLTTLVYLVSPSARAERYFYLMNEVGGKIIFTSRPCEGHKGLLFGYSYVKTGERAELCRTMIDGQVHAVFKNKEATYRIYNPAEVTMADDDAAGEPAKDQKKKPSTNVKKSTEI